MSDGYFWQRKLKEAVTKPKVKRKTHANRIGARIVVSLRLPDPSIEHLNLIKLITNKGNARIFREALEPALAKEVEELKGKFNESSWHAFVRLVRGNAAPKHNQGD